MEDVDVTKLVATAKSKVLAYLDPNLRKNFERLATHRNRSMSNLIETLVMREVQQAIDSGELPVEEE